METYDTVEPEENYAFENLEKTNATLGGFYDDILGTKDQKEGANAVSKSACATATKCLLFFVTTSVILSLGSLGFTVLEKVKEEAQVVVFHASNATAILNDGHREIVFSDIMINEGGSYDSTTGKFTAPVNGIYQFSVHLCAKTAIKISYNLIHGKKSILGRDSYKYEGGGTCASFSVPVIVKQSELVYVIIENTASTNKILYQDADDWYTFSGVLVRELN